jgi:exodeoxyribonuclease VII small subunit
MPAAKPPSAEPPTFEAAMAELDNLVERMENGQLPLAESLSAYQRGTELLRFCEAVLKNAEQQIKILDDGVLKDFKPAER